MFSELMPIRLNASIMMSNNYKIIQDFFFQLLFYLSFLTVQIISRLWIIGYHGYHNWNGTDQMFLKKFKFFTFGPNIFHFFLDVCKGEGAVVFDKLKAQL